MEFLYPGLSSDVARRKIVLNTSFPSLISFSRSAVFGFGLSMIKSGFSTISRKSLVIHGMPFLDMFNLNVCNNYFVRHNIVWNALINFTIYFPYLMHLYILFRLIWFHYTSNKSVFKLFSFSRRIPLHFPTKCREVQQFLL